MRSPSVSIVIPVLNEEGQLALCLEAIAKQTAKPLEVIVVDNNSADGTVALARRYPFVTVLHERQQGAAFARDRGFNAARGDVIGRIDGDSVIASDWVEKVQQIFSDSHLQAASGRVAYRYIALSKLVAAIDHKVRLYMTRRMGPLGEQFLYGSNMAIRRSAWQAVRDKVCHKPHVHEDIDLAAHLVGPDSGVVYRPELQATVDWRQAAAGPRQFLSHVWSNDRVFTEHKLKSRRYARQVAVFVSILYIPIHMLYQGYNHKTKRWSLVHCLTNAAPVRPSPVTDN